MAGTSVRLGVLQGDFLLGHLAVELRSFGRGHGLERGWT